MDSRNAKSKKLLATSKLRLKRFTFLIDVSLGRGVTEFLRANGFSVEDHTAYAAANADDSTWLERAGKRQRSNRKIQYIVLTKDAHIHRRQAEQRALLRACVRAFVITSGNITGPEIHAVI